MAFQQNGFQHNAFQVQVPSGGAEVRLFLTMGVGRVWWWILLPLAFVLL